ncbi:MAG: anti-sigma factor [Solirubrobacterales bacterium]|nr:anti-sigma factor [Solirubrobacterales bacterium]
MSIDREIAISYLLNELTGDERARFEAEMSANESLRQTVDELRPVVTRLEEMPPEAWEPAEPPPLDLARAKATAEAPLAEREAEFNRAERKQAGRRPLWLRLSGVLVTGAALLLVGFVIGSGTGGDDSGPASSAGPALALDRLGEAPPSAHGQVQMVSSEGDQMRLDVSGLKPNGAGDFYELWLLGEDGDLIALGSFNVGQDGKRTVELPLPVDPTSFEYFDVSIEKNDGGPEHSGRSVLRGLTTY